MDGGEEVVEVENDEVRATLFENCTHIFHLIKVFPLGRREEISLFWYPLRTALRSNLQPPFWFSIGMSTAFFYNMFALIQGFRVK